MPHSDFRYLPQPAGKSIRHPERLYLLNVVIPICFLFMIPSALLRWVGLGLIVLTAVVHLHAFKGGIRWRAASLVAEMVLMIATMVLLSPGYIWMIFYPTSVLGAGFNRKQIGLGLIAICLTLLTVVYIQSTTLRLATADWLVIGAGVIAGVGSAYGTWWQTQTVKSRHELRQANLRIERLTQIAERERISQDLHDVMGHELSMITLKSQLVERLIDRDPARAKQEVADIEKAARSALTRVREYIADIRQPNLQEEWLDAEKLLVMAGIAATVESTAAYMGTSGTVYQVFAMCIREAVTNLVRHSSAKNAYLKMWEANDQLHLIIADDGIGMPAENKSVRSERRTGTGLIGMRARLASVDGQLHIWSNGRSVTTGDPYPPAAVPWQRGAVLYLCAPLCAHTMQPLEEAQQL